MHAHAPDATLRREQDDHAARRLPASSTIGGLGVGDWLLPAVAQETVMTAIHALSKPFPGDELTAAQRRADALVSIAEIALRSGELPVTGGVKPHVSVLVGLDTLQRRAGAPAAAYGFGATSTAEWARRLCCDAGIARIITDPGGEPLDVGRASRTFTAAQTRAIIARDRRCTWPSCEAPLAWSDCHHIVHWPTAGPPPSTTPRCSAAATTTGSTSTATPSSKAPAPTGSTRAPAATPPGKAPATAPDPNRGTRRGGPVSRLAGVEI
jgi:hypothetical protein